MAAEEAQTVSAFVAAHPGITLSFVGVLLALISYLWLRLDAAKENGAKTVINGLHEALTQQRVTIDNTLTKLNTAVEKLEKTISELAAELFRDMKNLDRRLSKLEGEHEVMHMMKRRAEDKEES